MSLISRQFPSGILDALQYAMVNIDAKIVELNNAIDGVNQAVDGAITSISEANTNTVSSAISPVETAVSTANTGINEAKTAISTVNTAVGNVNTQVVNSESSIKGAMFDWSKMSSIINAYQLSSSYATLVDVTGKGVVSGISVVGYNNTSDYQEIYMRLTIDGNSNLYTLSNAMIDQYQLFIMPGIIRFNSSLKIEFDKEATGGQYRAWAVVNLE